MRSDDLSANKVEDNHTGAFSFIRILLLMAGVESNPGPSGKKFIFRYEYLLHEIGTQMLRRVFTHKVGTDFKVYLDNNPDRKRDFNKLLSSRNKPTPVQLQLLPPIDNSPSSDNFDITLLCCLLRNTCGLCSFSDQVWSNPQSTDTRLEADITRLRICRNELAHNGSVLEDETVLKTKWNDLCMILQSMSNTCGFSDVNSLIQSAENVEFDEKLQEKFENAKKEWLSEIRSNLSEVKTDIGEVKADISKVKTDIDGVQTDIDGIKTGIGGVKTDIGEVKIDIDGVKTTINAVKTDIGEVMTDISGVMTDIDGVKTDIDGVKTNINEVKTDINEVKTDINEVKTNIEEVKNDIGGVKSRLKNLEECNEDKTDIRKILIDAYQNNICSSLPLCPLLEDEQEKTHRLYELPEMYVVNYHKVEKQQTDKSPDELKKVKTCSDLFHVKDKDYKNIYLTGDAGVGKTSFCKFLSLLWCKSKLGEKFEKVDMQEYIDYLARFDFVFYVSLRDTHYTDLIAIIVNQLFFCQDDVERNRMYRIVKEILGNQASLVILDGLDEWIPKPTDKRKCEIPVRPNSLQCVYFTTCRPYKIENVRLSETNLDHQVKMTGLGETEMKSYVSNLIKCINTKYEVNKNKYEFMMAVRDVNILDMLHIPMTTSHLVMLWFDRPLTSMSKSLIYGNIVDMLFKLAHKKGIVIQQSKPSKIKLPDRLSELKHFKDHFSQIEQLCLLSFKLLFEHDTDITSLVFTRDQLASEPYCFSENETNVFCTIGILSKNKVKRKFGKQEHKLCFLHKSYFEFFAAIYVSTLDTSIVLELFSQCRTINDVLKYKNFLIFYAGLSIENLASLMTKIYSLISKDLDLTRVLSIFSDDAYNKRDQLLSLQDLILKCNIEGSYPIENSLPLEDFIFIDNNIPDTEAKYLRMLLLSNLNIVRLFWPDTGDYLYECGEITNLQVLHINAKRFNTSFYKLIKQNKSSLQIISIEDADGFFNLPSNLPLEDLHHLTSLSLCNIIMSHEDIQYLTQFLSKTRQLKHVRLDIVNCTKHARVSSNECASFELVHCNKLVYLDMKLTNIECSNINTSSIEYIKLRPSSKSIARSYYHIFNSIQYALELKYLDINGEYRLDDHLVETLITNVQYLSKIESIELCSFTIGGNISFLFHPSVKQVSITLYYVKMRRRWFERFIKSVLYRHCCIRCSLHHCYIRRNNGYMSRKESLIHIYRFIRSISAINIVEYDSTWYSHIYFVINDSQ